MTVMSLASLTRLAATEVPYLSRTEDYYFHCFWLVALSR